MHLPLDEPLARADVVSVNVALTDDTRNLLRAERLALMKPGAILVNTARGGIVDDEAVRRLLQEGRLGGAVLDVLGQEPPEPDALSQGSPARRTPSSTPHIAWHTEEALSRQFEELTENVLAFVRRRAPQPRDAADDARRMKA